MLRVGKGGRGSWKFDAEFKFSKIQNSHVEGGGGGGWWNQLLTFDAEFKFAKKKKISKNFLSFQAKMGMDFFWTLSTKWFPIRSIGEPQKKVK